MNEIDSTILFTHVTDIVTLGKHTPANMSEMLRGGRDENE